MEKKNIDWGNIGFGYMQTEKRYVSYYKNGAWDQGGLTEDANIVLNECAGVLQYAQTIFEGLKAYTTEDGRIVAFRPDLNAERMMDSARRLEMPEFPKERFMMPWTGQWRPTRPMCRPTAAGLPFTSAPICSAPIPSSA